MGLFSFGFFVGGRNSRYLRSSLWVGFGLVFLGIKEMSQVGIEPTFDL